MIQLGKCALFKEKAFAPRGREPAVAKNLDGGLARKVVAHAQVDHTHATFAKQPLKPVWAKLTGNEGLLPLKMGREALIEHRLRTRIFFEKRFELLTGFPAWAMLLQVGGALRGIQIRDGVKEILEAGVAVGIHRGHLTGAAEFPA